mgnify:CR=1 FL=1
MIKLNIESQAWANAFDSFMEQANTVPGLSLSKSEDYGLVELAFEQKRGGQFSMYGVDFDDGLSLFWMEGQYHEAIELNQRFPSQQEFLRFAVSTSSETIHYSTSEKLIHHLNPLMAGVRVGSVDYEGFLIPPNEEFLFALVDLVGVDPMQYEDNIFREVIPKLNRLIHDSQQKYRAKTFLGSHGLQVSETVQELAQSDYDNLARRAYLKGKALEILSDYIYHFENRKENLDERPPLNLQEITQIRKAARLLVEQIDRPPIIPNLAQQVGMSPTGLKRGFKIVFEMTIGQYLRKKRMYKALFLLQNTELKISGIAAEVGYKHAGHFSRQFQEQFGVSPSEVRKFSSQSAQIRERK